MAKVNKLYTEPILAIWFASFSAIRFWAKESVSGRTIKAIKPPNHQENHQQIIETRVQDEASTWSVDKGKIN